MYRGGALELHTSLEGIQTCCVWYYRSGGVGVPGALQLVPFPRFVRYIWCVWCATWNPVLCSRPAFILAKFHLCSGRAVNLNPGTDLLIVVGVPESLVGNICQ